MIDIEIAQNDDDIKGIANLANIIWHEHFTPIIGEKQVEYMLDKFQSYHALKKAVDEDGYVYYMAKKNGELVGYIGMHAEDDNVFLSKIYVEASCRRQGVASQLLNRVKTDYSDKNYFWLTVNRHNDIAVKTYEALGFYLWREQVTDIGDGFVMDDYVFRYDIEKP